THTRNYTLSLHAPLPFLNIGGGTLTLTPDEQNGIDFDFKKDNQHRDSGLGKSTSARSKESNFSKYEM
ncbi:hypothetical protein, partial [Morganella morganii]|uniref:hypothetical protein n=1 Tax=Morganella morganii TaxID=582 RepID=UPI001FFC3445